MIANFSRNELLQYSDWILNDVFRSIDQRRDYRAELARITVPSLFLAGPRDVLSPPDAVKETYDAVGAADKQFVICSRAQGIARQLRPLRPGRRAEGAERGLPARQRLAVVSGRAPRR